jgi:DNA-binding MarR family transcriptional regulator/catechol 2,3-dioxygenase-like lactoylglutathione lyase family enzyme
MPDTEEYHYATPTLMRAARGAYAQAIRAELYAIGVDDLPRNGAFILVGIHSSGAARQDMMAELGITKQAVSQLVDILVSRGYVDRDADPGDRRRVSLSLTERGEQVVHAVFDGTEAVEAQLRDLVGPGQIESMRSALRALAQIKVAGTAGGAVQARPGRQLMKVSPIFPVRDVAAALDHYASLGFQTIAYAGGADYGFADRDGLGVHLAGHHGHDLSDPSAHQHSGAEAYLYVRDADALYAEWSRPGIGGRTSAVEPTPYKLREGSHSDPDGNLIRFGSPMTE